MDGLCFSEYAKCLKKAMKAPNYNQNVVDLLLGWIAKIPGVQNKNGDVVDIDKTLVSKMLSRKIDVPKSIKEACSLDNVQDDAEKYFEKEVLPYLNPQQKPKMLEDMREAVKYDDDMVPSQKEEFMNLLSNGEEAKFLAHLFMYVVAQDNRSSSKVDTGEETDINIMENPQATELPVLQPNTHFNIFAISRTCLQDNEPFDVLVEAEWLTQDGDKAIENAFRQNTDEMIEQIKKLPCLFSNYGEYDEMNFPVNDYGSLPRDDQWFAFGYIEDITHANGRTDTMLKVRPRIEWCFPLKELINGNTDYIRIGIRYPAVFFREGLTIVKRDLIAGLRDLGIQI